MLTITAIVSLALAAYRRSFPLSAVSDNTFAATFATHDVDDNGRLFPKGRYSSEESPLSSMHMLSVEAAQLLEAGYTFSMRDAESIFDADRDHELRGVALIPERNSCRYCDASAIAQLLRTMMRQDAGNRYCPRHDGRSQADAGQAAFGRDVSWSELDEHGDRVTIIDVIDATDARVEDGDLMTDNHPVDTERVILDGIPTDRIRVTPGRVPFFALRPEGTGPDRWVWETEIAAAVESDEMYRIAQSIPDNGRDYGEQGAAALRRYRRCGDLVSCAKKLGESLRCARLRGNRQAVNRALGLLSKLRVGVKARYAASVKLVVERGETAELDSKDWDWWMLYLTKAQTEAIYRAVSTALHGKRPDFTDLTPHLEPMSRLLLG